MISKKVAIWLGILLSITTIITTILGLLIVYCQLLEKNEIDKLKFTIDFIDKFYSTPQPNIDNRTISQIYLSYHEKKIYKDDIDDVLGNYFIQLANCIKIEKCGRELFSLEYKENLIKLYYFFCKDKPSLSDNRGSKNSEEVANLMKEFNQELLDLKIQKEIYPGGLPNTCIF